MKRQRSHEVTVSLVILSLVELNLHPRSCPRYSLFLCWKGMLISQQTNLTLYCFAIDFNSGLQFGFAMYQITWIRCKHSVSMYEVYSVIKLKLFHMFRIFLHHANQFKCYFYSKLVWAGFYRWWWWLLQTFCVARFLSWYCHQNNSPNFVFIWAMNKWNVTLLTSAVQHQYLVLVVLQGGAKKLTFGHWVKKVPQLILMSVILPNANWFSGSVVNLQQSSVKIAPSLNLLLMTCEIFDTSFTRGGQ